MSKNQIKSLGDLEKGIKQLLRENRYSFSDNEKELLNQCLALIKKAKGENILNTIVDILKILGRLFIFSQDISNLF